MQRDACDQGTRGLEVVQMRADVSSAREVQYVCDELGWRFEASGRRVGEW